MGKLSNYGLQAKPQYLDYLNPTGLSNATDQYGSMANYSLEPANSYAPVNSLENAGQGFNFAGTGVGLNEPMKWGSSLGSSLYDQGMSPANYGVGSANSGGLFSSFLQQRNADNSTSGGYGGVGLNVAGGLANLFMGMQQYGLAKDTFNENKRQFELNYGAQKKMTNARLEDLAKSRVLRDPTKYGSAEDYMAKYGV